MAASDEFFEWPSTLPGPVTAPRQSAERRELSALPGPRQSRPISRDRRATVQLEFAFNFKQLTVFSAWLEEINKGGAWFSASAPKWPSPEGGTSEYRFIGAPSYPRYIPNVGWRISALAEVRTAHVCIPWVQRWAVPDVGEPEVFGVGMNIARDPVTGYIWSVGSNAGSFVKVYDPLSMTDVDTIAIGDDAGSTLMCIVYLGGFFYVGVPGNSYTSGPPIVSKIDAASRTIVGQGDTNYLGAVAHIGLLSHDRSNVYISVTNGVGNGTAVMSTDAPFPFAGGTANSNWLFNAIYNDYSGVRAYTGYGAFVDLRGAVTLSVSTAGYLDSAHLQDSRMLVKPCSAVIYVSNMGGRGVIAVNSLSGAVRLVDDSFAYVRAMYYSPESDRLYVQGADALFGLGTVRAFDGTTFAPIADYPTYAVAQGGSRGGSLYLGGEAFLGSESAIAGGFWPGRLWRLRFPS